jgi:inhibitor of cysteine peptidase
MLRGTAQARTAAFVPGRIDAVCAFAALALTACATTLPPPARAIDASADGLRVRLAQGQALNVTVDANPATGYRWVVDRGAAAVLLPVGRPMYTPLSASAPLVGGGGTMTFAFVAAAAGSDTLQLAYRRPTDKSAPAARSLHVDIVVQ